MKNISKALVGAVMTVALLSGNIVCADVIERDETTTVEATTEAATEATEDQVSDTDAGSEFTLEGATFETMYGSQLGNYLNHQYYYDLKEIPIAESNFYFIHTFTDMSQSAMQGSYPITSEGFVDLAFDLGDAEEEGFNYSYFGEYFREFAENQILSTYIVLDMAEEANVTLSDEYTSMIDEYMKTVEDIATKNNLTLDQYLELFYGDKCDTEAFRGILERYYLSSVYSEEYVKNYEFTDEELYVPKVCHALFAPDDPSPEADETAKAAAENFLKSCKSVEDIMTYGTKMAEDGTVKECAEYSVSKGRFVSEFEDWAYDAERKDGDMGIVKTVYGYHVIGYYGLTDNDDESKQRIALKALNDEVGSIVMSDVHEFYTNDTIEKPIQIAAPETSETDATSETVISLPLDEEGNISLETTAGEEAQITAEPMKTPKSLSMTRKITIGLAVAVIVAIIVVAVVMVTKSRKQQEEIIKAAGKQKSSEDESEEEE